MGARVVQVVIQPGPAGDRKWSSPLIEFLPEREWSAQKKFFSRMLTDTTCTEELFLADREVRSVTLFLSFRVHQFKQQMWVFLHNEMRPTIKRPRGAKPISCFLFLQLCSSCSVSHLSCLLRARHFSPLSYTSPNHWQIIPAPPPRSLMPSFILLSFSSSPSLLSLLPLAHTFSLSHNTQPL